MSINIDESIKQQVREILKNITNVVTVKVFLSENRCLTCNETVAIMNIIKDLAPEGKIKIEEYHAEKDGEELKKYNIVNFPAVILEGDSVKGRMQYTGIPSGYEFGSVIEDLLDIGTGNVTLKPESIEKLSKVDKNLLMQVFVTPTCPYCPISVRLAHKAGMLNEYIVGEMVEATEYPELAQKFHIMGVPKTIIFHEGKNILEFEGAYPEDRFVEKVLEAYNKIQ